MGDPKSQSSKQEVEALHAALLRQERERGTSGRLIPVEEWEGILAKTLGVATRQTANDKTWFMHRLGLLVHEKRKGVIIQDVNT